MEKGKKMLRGTGTALLLMAVLISGAAVYAVENGDVADGAKRADVIVIDTMAAFGRLERPPVLYRHDKHTEALAKQNKDCSACHLKNEKSGPVTCGACHAKQPDVISNWQPIVMDKSLHYRHTKKLDNKCALCHHEYNAQEKKLVYVEGKEGACLYCHKAQTEENRISIQEASHEACIRCHQERVAKKLEAGPFECSGCHSPEKQLAIAVVDNVPRIKRNQPDYTFVKAGTKSALTPEGSLRAKAVPFNHKGHEEYNNTCVVCHHASLTSCADCHTINGAKEGNFIQLDQAMHQIGAQASCLGCHTTAQQDKSCAGCHSFIGQAAATDTLTCKTCHMEGAPSGAAISGKPEENALAAMLIASRVPVSGTIATEDIPETVKINKLEKSYQSVEMPHRKIVQALVKGIGDNKLAGYFHRDQATLCQGCHHNSPPALKPPQCASCHGKPFMEGKPYTPGLMGAYHIQCMGCHAEMKIEKAQGCTGCHKEK